MIPKLCIGDANPHDDLVWVVRLRNPFVIARAEPLGVLGLHLDAWPPVVETATPPGKLRKIMEGMGEAWCEVVDELPGLPRSWSWTFVIAEPPDFLLLDAVESPWTGILQPRRGILWHVAEVNGCESIEWLPEFGGKIEFPADTRAVAKWYRDFCKAEDALPDDEDD